MENSKRSKEIVNEDSFDIGLTGNIGEKMYFLNLQLDKEALEKDGNVVVWADETNIYPVTIYKIAYKSGFPVIMDGIKETGKKVSFVQEMFFETYKDALSAVQKIKKIYENGSKYRDLYEVFEESIDIKYRFIWKFAIERYDIILNPDNHYTIKDIEAAIDPANAYFNVSKTEDHMYIPTKKIIAINNNFVPFIIRKL